MDEATTEPKPTEAEYALAAKLQDELATHGPAVGYRLLAHAFAEQRAKYEAVADEWDGYVDLDGAFFADLIRKVARG